MARVVIVAAIAGAVALSVWSPIFDIRTLAVDGLRHTTVAEIRAVADIDGSDNLLLVSTRDMAQAIETLPWVKRARVERKLFGTIEIKVVERRAAMVIATGAERWTVDRNGVVLAPGAVGRDRASIALTATEDLSTGERVASEPARAALIAFGALPAHVQERVESAVAPTADRITLVLENGLEIRYGGPERAADKADVIAAILERLKRSPQPAAYIDVRVPASPAIGTVGPAPVPTPTITPEDPVADG